MSCQDVPHSFLWPVKVSSQGTEQRFVPTGAAAGDNEIKQRRYK